MGGVTYTKVIPRDEVVFWKCELQIRQPSRSRLIHTNTFKPWLSEKIGKARQPAVSEHAHNTGHKPLRNEVKFIDHDPYYYTRRVKEAIHIRLHPENINRDSGIEIPEAWMSTIKKHNNRRAARANHWVKQQGSKCANQSCWKNNWSQQSIMHFDLIAWRRLAVCSRNVAIYITRDYIVRQTKN